VDARSDVYGIGTVLYQLITGSPPFDGADSQEIVGRHIREPVPSAGLSRDGVPKWIAGVVLRCMAKHPDDRFPTARAVLEAIQAGKSGAHGAAVDPMTLLPRADESPTETLPSARAERLPRGWLVGMAAASLAAVLVVVSAGGQREPEVPGYRTAEQGAGFDGRDDWRGAPSEAALVVENRLAQPIALSVADTALTIPPGEAGRLRLPNDEPLEGSWAMVQPVAGDRMLGMRVEGAIVAEQVEGEIHRVVDAGTGGPWVAPTVVNETGRPLGAAVVGREDSLDCECRISSGDSLRLGYYRWTTGTALRVTDAAGWSARLTGFGERRNPVSGAVVVRVERSHLRPPSKATPRRSKAAPEPAAERRNPLGSFLPVR
jgi:hypothetical protein